MKSAIMHIARRNAITLRDIIRSAVIQIAVMQSVVMLSVVMLSVVAPLVPSRNEIESLPFFQPNLAKIVRLIT